MAKKKYTPLEIMKMAIEESHRSIGEHKDKTDPLVGAIIAAKDGVILGKAHRGEMREGEHCEFTLIERRLRSENLRGCALYVTLEPCTDESRTLPKRGCVTHIKKARLSKVYIGVEDPNPKIAQEGIKALRKKGSEVEMFPSSLQEIIWKDNAKFKHEFGFIEKEEKSGNLKPTGLGIMLFGKTPEIPFPQTVFKVEINYGKGKPEVRDFKGALVTQLPAVLDLIKDKGLKMTMDKSSGKRKDVADFPFEILLEAVVNAVIHRDYTIKGATNYLFIDPDKIIVRSPGAPTYPLTLEELQDFDAPSLSRNPKIMYVFNQMHLAEQRGIGLRNMKHLPEKGFPLPTFRMKAGMLEVTFGRTKEYIAKVAGLKDINLMTEDDKEALLFIQKKGEVSRSEFAAEFDLNDKTAQRRLGSLIKKKLIVMIGDRKGARYKSTR